jgi:hypothetical protein
MPLNDLCFFSSSSHLLLSIATNLFSVCTSCGKRGSARFDTGAP